MVSLFDVTNMLLNADMMREGLEPKEDLVKSTIDGSYYAISILVKYYVNGTVIDFAIEFS